MNEQSNITNEQKILIVDDDKNFLRLASHALNRQGFQVITAEDGASALRLFQKNDLTAILLDIMLPDTDGYSVCETIRKADGGRSVPVIMITSLEDIEAAERAYHSGATDFITKPVNWNTLSLRIRFILRANLHVSSIIQKALHDSHLLDSISDFPEEQKDEIDKDLDFLESIRSLEREVGGQILNELLAIVKSGVQDDSFKEFDDPKWFEPNDDVNTLPVIQQAKLQTLRKCEVLLSTSVIEELTGKFVNEFPVFEDNIKQALEKEDICSVLMESVQLRSLCQLVGARRLEYFCHELEQPGRIDFFHYAETILNQLRIEFMKFKEELEKQVNFKHPSS